MLSKFLQGCPGPYASEPCEQALPSPLAEASAQALFLLRYSSLAHANPQRNCSEHDPSSPLLSPGKHVCMTFGFYYAESTRSVRVLFKAHDMIGCIYPEMPTLQSVSLSMSWNAVREVGMKVFEGT